MVFHEPTFRLVDRLDGVVPAFHIDVGLHRFQEFERVPVGKDCDGVDRGETGQDGGAIVLGIDRSIFALDGPDRGVAVEADQQNVTFGSRGGEIGDMAGVEDVEAAVGDDQSAPVRAERSAPLRKPLKGNNLRCQVHGHPW